MSVLGNKLSICIPTYKRLDYIYSLIETIPEDIPIMVSDNGNFINNELDKYVNVSIDHTDIVLPMFSNWNNAIRQINTEWFIIPGDDDLFHKDVFETISILLEKYKDAGMIIFGHVIIDDNLNVQKGWVPKEEKYLRPPFGLNIFKKGVDARVPSIIFNTVKFKSQGMFDERFSFTAADSLIIQKMSLFYPVAFIPKNLGIYRVWQNSFTNNKIFTKGWFDQIALWLNEMKRLIPIYGKELEIDMKQFTSYIYASNINYALSVMRSKNLNKYRKIKFLFTTFKPSLICMSDYVKLLRHKF